MEFIRNLRQCHQDFQKHVKEAQNRPLNGENGDGGCDVSVEYELQPGHEHLELADVSIKIPIPSGVGAPVIGSCDGDYNHDIRKNVLEWNLPIIGKY